MSAINATSLLQLSTPIPWSDPKKALPQPDCPLCPGSKPAKRSREDLRYDWVVDRPFKGKICKPQCAFTASGAYSCIPGEAPESRKCSSVSK
jgi:hypothetical protein